MATKLGRTVAYLEGLLTKKSKNPLITWSCKVTRQLNAYYICTTRLSMATTHDKIVT